MHSSHRFILHSVRHEGVRELSSFFLRLSHVFLGGLSAVIWTDFVQVFIMIIGAFVLMALSKSMQLICHCNYKNDDQKFIRITFLRLWLFRLYEGGDRRLWRPPEIHDSVGVVKLHSWLHQQRGTWPQSHLRTAKVWEVRYVPPPTLTK